MKVQTCAQILDRHTFPKAFLDECANIPASLELPREMFAECQSYIAIHVRKLQGVMPMFYAGWILICNNVRLNAVLAPACCCDIALKFIKQIRTSKEL